VTARVLVAEGIAEGGLALLRDRFQVDVELGLSPDALRERIGSYDALVVRSATRVDAPLLAAASRLRVIGRAGTGVDNVDVEEATRRGIVVANAPGSNMVSAAEHAVGLLLAVARNIPQADAALKAHRWERARFGGVELDGKRLAVLGFGRIGQLVAARARGLGMTVVAYDPFVAPDRFREMQAEHARSLEEALERADFVTLHTPLTEATRHLVRAETIALMPWGVRIVNAARGGLVDLDALVAALRDGHVAAAGLDVFPSEPYTDGEVLDLPNVVVTPHLGASTREAQDRAGVVVAEQVAAALEGGLVTNAVNVPSLPVEQAELLGAFMPLARKLGRLSAGLGDGAIERVEVTYAGGLAGFDTRLLTSAAVAGVFTAATDEPVNLVNARALAEERGVGVEERRSAGVGPYTNLLTVCAPPGAPVSGTTIGVDQRPWLVEVQGHQVEIELDPSLIVMRNDDRPGIIGSVGTLLGSHGVNIANMSVSRESPGERAVMVLSIDGLPEHRTLTALEALDGVSGVRSVVLDEAAAARLGLAHSGHDGAEGPRRRGAAMHDERKLETDLVSHRGDDGTIEAEPVPAERAKEGAPPASDIEPERAGEEAAEDR
jgi:D-3-phosphoglycerate dehydrogenase / 2-oxoglutarate reductase